MDEQKKEELFEVSRHLKRAENGLKNANISERNKAVIVRLEQYLIAKGLSIMRVRKYIINCKILAETYGKDFEDFTKDDCDAVMTLLRQRVINQAEINKEINIGKDIQPKRYKENSLNDFTGVLKMLFKFLDGVTCKGQSPRACHLVKKNVKNKLRKEDLVTEEQVNQLVASASTLQYKTIISILFESAARPSELRGVDIKDITRTERGYKIEVDGKTGQGYIYCITSAPLLTSWLNNHAFRSPNSPLFYLLKDGKPKYWRDSTWRKMIHGLSKKVLGRAIPLYRLRHSRAEDLIEKGMQTSKIKMVLRHAKGSNVLESTYLHMDDSDTESAYCDAAGVEMPVQERKKSVFVAKKCKCGTDLSPHQLMCEKCGMIADPTIKTINEASGKFSFNAFNAEEKAVFNAEIAELKAELLRELRKEMVVKA
ncbi:MAG: site-specific integrase [Nanoarchaeota archaeon]|nr:site-specific integrase [Nanoarchaeota archaeon]MBU4451591.1 site-specific integrase [Nanoarchaeota archaeon]